MKALLTQALSDGDGNISSVRLALLLTLLLTLTPWAIVCIHNWQIADLPEGVRWVIGIVAGGKLAQNFTESGPEPKQ